MTPKERAEYVISNGGNYGSLIETSDIERQIIGALQEVLAEAQTRSEQWADEYEPARGCDSSGARVALESLSEWIRCQLGSGEGDGTQ